MNYTEEYLNKKPNVSSNPWKGIIINAEERGFFTSKEVEESCSWENCPVGLITKDPNDVLHFLGNQFCKAVKNNNFYESAKLLVQINS
jgi:hypothetical protein